MKDFIIYTFICALGIGIGYFLSKKSVEVHTITMTGAEIIDDLAQDPPDQDQLNSTSYYSYGFNLPYEISGDTIRKKLKNWPSRIEKDFVAPSLDDERFCNLFSIHVEALVSKRISQELAFERLSTVHHFLVKILRTADLEFPPCLPIVTRISTQLPTDMRISLRRL